MPNNVGSKCCDTVWKAGIQKRRLDTGEFLQRAPWMPACAGMTSNEVSLPCHSATKGRVVDSE